MKVKVKSPFLDDNGIHKMGDITEVNFFDSSLMELVSEPKKEPEKKRNSQKEKVIV